MAKLASILVGFGKVDNSTSVTRVCKFNAFHTCNFGRKATFTIDILTNFTPIKKARKPRNAM